jgi:hypothetical protein
MLCHQRLRASPHVRIDEQEQRSEEMGINPRFFRACVAPNMICQNEVFGPSTFPIWSLNFPHFVLFMVQKFQVQGKQGPH